MLLALILLACFVAVATAALLWEATLSLPYFVAILFWDTRLGRWLNPPVEHQHTAITTTYKVVT